MALKSEFDEKAILVQNLNYLVTSLEVRHTRLFYDKRITKINVLQLEGLAILDARESGNEKIEEECCPGKPFLVLRTEVLARAEACSIDLSLIPFIQF